MRRGSVPGLVLLFGATALVTGLASLPLAMVAGLAGVAPQAGRISGSVWNGRIEDIVVAGRDVGDARLSLELLPLLTGVATADVTINGGPLTGRGKVTLRGRRVSVSDAQLIGDLGGLNVRDLFGAPMQGTLDVRAASLTLSDGACEAGTVDVSTDTLIAALTPYGGTGFVLQGSGTCADGVLNLPLSGEGPDGRVAAILRLAPAGYQIDLTIVPMDQRIGMVLAQNGFSNSNGIYRRVQRGSIS